MAQTERMAKLVSSYLKQIRSTETVDGPLFCVVEVSITTVYGEVSVSQSATRSIERISVPVFAFLESNFDMDLTNVD